MINMQNIIKGNGGVDFLMAKEFIRKLMVTYQLNIGDFYTGSFKNGLKHG